MSRPIETRYKGYRFRSRLEARWAVFFDALGIDYRYEPEGFDLNGLFYLPDFYLPTEQPGSWIEVKPEIPRDAEGWSSLLRRLFELSKFQREHAIAILGDPYPGEYKLFFVGYIRETDELIIPRIDKYAEQEIVFAESDCGAIHLAHVCPPNVDSPNTIRIRDIIRDCRDPTRCVMHIYGDSAPRMAQKCPDLFKAFSRARAARFEYGEQP
jgi:hypothetical protein